MVRFEESQVHDLETKRAIKTLQDMNTKHGLTPDAGVEKLKQGQNQALQDHVKDIMAGF